MTNPTPNGYLSSPPGGKGPGVLVLHAWWGLNQTIKSFCDRLAAAGYTALAPDLYHGELAGHTEMDKAGALMSSLPPDRAARDMSGAVDFLADHDATTGDGIGVMGFCMGGMYCFKSAGLAFFDRIASFYGMIHTPEMWSSATHLDPLEYVRRGDASKVLAIIGSKDTWTPPEHVQELRDAGVNVVEYSQADHGFAHDTSRPAHRVDDAADAFSRARAWLA